MNVRKTNKKILAAWFEYKEMPNVSDRLSVPSFVAGYQFAIRDQKRKVSKKK